MISSPLRIAPIARTAICAPNDQLGQSQGSDFVLLPFVTVA